jgi:hypothetical protein
MTPGRDRNNFGVVNPSYSHGELSGDFAARRWTLKSAFPSTERLEMTTASRRSKPSGTKAAPEPPHIAELRRLAADVDAPKAHRLRANLAMARLFPVPRPKPEPTPPKPRLREMSPAKRTLIHACCAGQGTEWAELLPATTWSDLTARGITKADIIECGYNPDLIAEGPAGPMPVRRARRRPKWVEGRK